MFPMLQSYQLFIKLSRDSEVQIGKLGFFRFPRGGYIYTGSAKAHMEKRIERHLSKHKKPRWHIDYLLEVKDARITQVTRSEISECKLNKKTSGETLVNGFGSSDCLKKCGSHLKFTGDTQSK